MAVRVGLVGMQGETGRGPKGRLFLGEEAPEACVGVEDRYVGWGETDRILRASRSDSFVERVRRETRGSGRAATGGSSS